MGERSIRSRTISSGMDPSDISPFSTEITLLSLLPKGERPVAAAARSKLRASRVAVRSLVISPTCKPLMFRSLTVVIRMWERPLFKRVAKRFEPRTCISRTRTHPASTTCRARPGMCQLQGTAPGRSRPAVDMWISGLSQPFTERRQHLR